MQWGLMHIDIKTAFLQGEDYDAVRNVVCQLPPEMGLPPYMGAVLVKPAYGMNDAPRRWWNRLDSSLQRYGLTPTRADRCCYVMYDKKHPRTAPAAGTKVDRPSVERQSSTSETIESLLEYLLDPVSGSPSRGKHATGYICLHVDDLFASGTPEFLKWLEKMILTEYEIGSLANDNIMFVGQRIRWQGNCLVVDQDGKVDELTEIKIPKGSSDSQKVTASEHTEYRSVLGGLNWVQSRTQFHIAYRFSRAASAAANPTYGDIRELNKTVRQVRATPVRLTYWPLQGNLRILGYPDAASKTTLTVPHSEDKPSSLLKLGSQELPQTMLSEAAWWIMNQPKLNEPP